MGPTKLLHSHRLTDFHMKSVLSVILYGIGNGLMQLKSDGAREITRRKLKSGTWSDIKAYLWVYKPHQRETGVLRVVLRHFTALW